MKTIALYLPQFHQIPENDNWWGTGFTEWVNVKKAKPVYQGHDQPRVPLNDNYYDLSNVEVMRWQTEIARKHGVYGFCFYHYWFDGKLLLEKPIENYLSDKTIDFPFCISWANEHWTNQWVTDNWTVLIEQKYGGEREWKAHFDYLYSYFSDPRYIKQDGKPVFVIYRPELIDKRKEMFEYWNVLAKEKGLPGICFVFQRAEALLNNSNIDMSMFDFCAEYQPGLSQARIQRREQKFQKLRNIKRKFTIFLEKKFKVDARNISILPKKKGLRTDDYDLVWENLLKSPFVFKNTIPSAFVGWDNTPRKGENGSVIVGANPEKFKYYFKRLIQKAKECCSTDLIFIFAWNEWAEGGYLEPDQKNGYAYLEALREALEAENELPY